MRKVFVVALMVVAMAALVPAQADTPPECIIIGEGGPRTTDMTCQYTADGAGSYSQATTNPWRIDVHRHTGFDPITGAKVYQDSTLASAGTGPPSTGSIATRGALGNLDADLVTVVLEWECIPGGEGFGGCGQLGYIAAGDN